MSNDRKYDKNDKYTKPCMTEDCPNKAMYNGICSTCYGECKRLIERGETSWNELEDMGMIKRSSPLTKSFLKKKSESENNDEPTIQSSPLD